MLQDIEMTDVAIAQPWATNDVELYRSSLTIPTYKTTNKYNFERRPKR